MFQNLDDVVLHVEGRVLDALDRHLAEVAGVDDGTPPALRLAHAYLAFTSKNPRLWNLLFEHHLPDEVQLPPWYQQKLETLMGRVEEALKPVFPDAAAEERKRAARVLWAGVHGITSLSTATKLSVVAGQGAPALIDDLVTTYLAGLGKRD